MQFRKTKYFFTLLLFTISGQSQTEQINGIGLFYPGYLHEVPISYQMTGRLQLGMLPQIQQKEIGINGYLSGLASLSLRNYYNLKKRENRGKKTELNSANYFSITFQYITPPVVFFDDECNCIDFEGDPILRAENEKENIMQGILLGVNWGIQRHFNRKLSLDINLGPAYSTKKKELTFLTNLTLIVWLNQNKDDYW